MGDDAGADGGGLCGENGGAVGNCVWEVLDDESRLGECGCESDGGAASGTADLNVRVSPPHLLIKHSISKIGAGCFRWVVVTLTSTTTAPSSNLSQS